VAVAVGQPDPLSESRANIVAVETDCLPESTQLPRCPKFEVAPRVGTDDVGRAGVGDEFPKLSEVTQLTHSASAAPADDRPEVELDADTVDVRDWALEDPDGADPERARRIRDTVEERVEALFDEVEADLTTSA